MRVFVRTNFNKEIGLGHLSRCIRLCDFFVNKGFKCKIFIDKKINLKIFFFNEQKYSD